MDIFDQPEQEMPHAVNVTPEEQEAIQRVLQNTHSSSPLYEPVMPFLIPSNTCVKPV